MYQSIYRMHLVAGKTYGEEATCGSKIDYRSEASAAKAAIKMGAKYSDKDFEEYPCCWCGGWHVGRAMTEEEVVKFYAKANPSKVQ